MYLRNLLFVFLALSISITQTAFSQNPDSIPFATAVTYATGTDPWGLFISDLEEDEDKDIAVANITSNTVSILRNSGDGSFSPKVDYGTGGGHPISVFSSDLDGDGDKDLAIANDFSYGISVLKNNGDGTFSSSVDYYVGGQSNSIFASDFDKDLDEDLIVANYTSNAVSVLRNIWRRDLCG